jgi:hypothetical protein
VVIVTAVAVLLLAPTPLIRCRLCMRIRYPRDLWMAMIPITRPFRGSYELAAGSTLGALLEPFSESFGRCLIVKVRRAVRKPLRWVLPHPLQRR